MDQCERCGLRSRYRHVLSDAGDTVGDRIGQMVDPDVEPRGVRTLERRYRVRALEATFGQQAFGGCDACLFVLEPC